MKERLNKILTMFLAGVTTLSGLSIPTLALEKTENNVTVEYIENEVDGTVLFHLNKTIVQLTKNNENKATGDLGYYLTTEKGNYNTSNKDVEALPTVTKLDKDTITISAEDDSNKTIDVNVLENESKKINDFTTAESRQYKNKLNLKETYSETENNKYAGDWNLESDKLTNVKAGHYIGNVKALFNLDNEEEDIPNTVYAKLCDEDNNGTGETLYLSNNLNFSCNGTLKNNYSNQDNNAVQGTSEKTKPMWTSNVSTIDRIVILNNIKINNGYYYFGNMKNINSIEGLEKMDTSNVTNMRCMFLNTGYNSTSFTLILGNKFDTSNVIYMNSMFDSIGYKSTSFTLDLGDKFDTSKVENMSLMFSDAGEYATAFTLDLGDKFDTSNVTDMSRMFLLTGWNSTNFTLDLGDNFDTSKVTTMEKMFNYTGAKSTNFNINLGNKFDTSNVTNMQGMFQGTGRDSTSFTLDLGDKFDTSKATDMSFMFNNAGVKTIYATDKFVVSDGTNSTSMFYDATKLVGGNGTTYSGSNPKDKTYARIDGKNGLPGYFTDRSVLGS